jgi:hypothetical protein
MHSLSGSPRGGPLARASREGETAARTRAAHPLGPGPFGQDVWPVEVLGRYSNHAEQGELLSHLLETVPPGLKTVSPRTPRRVLRRLQQAEIDDVVTAYQAGATLAEMASAYRAHPQTISQALERRGVARRFHLLRDQRLERAIFLYRQGQSLATIGSELDVSPDTVGYALRMAGVPIRPRPGWRY